MVAIHGKKYFFITNKHAKVGVFVGFSIRRAGHVVLSAPLLHSVV